MRREPRRPVAPEQPAPLGGSTPPIWSPPPEATPDRDEGTEARHRAGNPWPSTAAFGPKGLEIGGVAPLSNTLCTASVSMRSLKGVEVPWALM